MKVPDSDCQNTLYSVIIPAYNEECYLPYTLSSLLKAMEEVKYKGELIVVDNNSTDRTPNIAEDYGAKLLFEEKNQISRARNTGAKEAKGRFFIFLDADTTVSADLLNQALLNLERGDCCGGGAFMVYDGLSGINLGSLFNYVMKRLRLAAGCFIYCLNAAFKDTGGFSENLYASEEIWFSLRLKKWGKKREKPFKVITNHHVITSNRKLDHPIQLSISIVIAILFPFFIFFRAFCGHWYGKNCKIR